MEKEQTRHARLAANYNEYRRLSGNSATTLEDIDKAKYKNEIKTLDNEHREYWNRSYNHMREYNRINNNMNSKFGNDHVSKYGSAEYNRLNNDVNRLWDMYQHPIEDAEEAFMKAKQTKDRKNIRKARKARNKTYNRYYYNTY